MSIADAFEAQARGCASLGSPFMHRLLMLMAERLRPGTPVADRIFDWPGDPAPKADNVPLRLAGALHALKLQGKALEAVYPPNDVDDGALWAELAAAMKMYSDEILDWMTSAPQTNEVRRAAVILPSLALLNSRFRQPVALFELGASGGLNMRADRFSLDAGGVTIGPADAAVRLRPDWRGETPPRDLPEIVHRAGVDLNPLDPKDPGDRLRLLAYLWPDQPERIERTRAAIAEAMRTPAEIAAEDAGVWLDRALAPEMQGALRLVYHTIAWQYFSAATARRAEAAIARAAATATEQSPFAHLSMEADGGEGAAVKLTMWPGVAVQQIARADFHGRWIDWQAN